MRTQFVGRARIVYVTRPGLQYLRVALDEARHPRLWCMMMQAIFVGIGRWGHRDDERGEA